jgi:hypothetical protein
MPLGLLPMPYTLHDNVRCEPVVVHAEVLPGAVTCETPGCAGLSPAGSMRLFSVLPCATVLGGQPLITWRDPVRWNG